MPLILFDGTIPWISCIHGKTTPLKMSRAEHGLRLDVPKEELVPIDTIVVLTRE